MIHLQKGIPPQYLPPNFRLRVHEKPKMGEIEKELEELVEDILKEWPPLEW